MNKYNFQVGDWCYDKDKKEYHQITIYDYVALGVDHISGGACLLPIFDTLAYEPIGITEEWLDLNFERYYPIGEGYPYWRTKDHRLEISTLSNMVGRDYDAECLHKIHLDNEDMETIGGCAACYVHHIQHLCRDCEYEFKPKFN